MYIRVMVLLPILLCLLISSSVALGDDSTSSESSLGDVSGLGDVYVKNYVADIYLDGTLKESYTYAVESSDTCSMLYRYCDLSLSNQSFDSPYVELLNISAPQGTVPYENDCIGQVHILPGYNYSANNTSSEVEELAGWNEVGCFAPEKFSKGYYSINYTFRVHPCIEYDYENSYIDLELASWHLPYQNVTVAVHDPENLVVKIFPYPGMNVTRQGDAWVMYGSSGENEMLGIEMLLLADAADDMQGFPTYVPDLKKTVLEAHEPPPEETLSFAIPADNLNGDSAWDMLVMNFTSNSSEDSFRSEVSAIDGSSGELLWNSSFPDAIAYAFPVKDLNSDGSNDVVIDVVLEGISFIPFSRVMAVSGCNGSEIWSRPSVLAATIAYPLEKNSSELLVHLFGIDVINNSIVTEISSIDATDGAEIDARTFPGSIALEYPAGNLTQDYITDSLIATYEIDIDSKNSSTSMPSTRIAALSGSGRIELWDATFKESMAIAVPSDDVTGDGLDDLVVYELLLDANNSSIADSSIADSIIDGGLINSGLAGGSLINTDLAANIPASEVTSLYDQGGLGLGEESSSLSTRISAVRGIDGVILWQRTYNDSIAIATMVPDLTGDGLKDFVVSKIGTSDEENASQTEAVKGDDGRLLWRRTPMMIVSS
jgi:hypothetical protein